jgi:hypothetical protein
MDPGVNLEVQDSVVLKSIDTNDLNGSMDIVVKRDNSDEFK